MKRILFLSLLFLSAGCSKPTDSYTPDFSDLVPDDLHFYNAEIESNTTWSGSFGDQTIEGAGNTDVFLTDASHPVCVVVQKKTETGLLRLRVVKHIIIPQSELVATDWVETTADYGEVSACSEE